MFYCMLHTGVVFVVPLLCIEIDHIQDQAFTCVAYITVCVMYQVISIVYVWHKMYEKWHLRWREFVDEHGRNPWRNMHFDNNNNNNKKTNKVWHREENLRCDTYDSNGGKHTISLQSLGNSEQMRPN